MIASKSIIIIVLLGVAFAVSADAKNITESKCPRMCPRKLNRVCAWNGKQFKNFGNPCALKSTNCDPKNVFKTRYIRTLSDWCTTKLVHNLPEKLGIVDFNKYECTKPCRHYKPVCVSNGKLRSTVGNKCIMETYNCILLGDNERSQLFRVLRDGDC